MPRSAEKRDAVPRSGGRTSVLAIIAFFSGAIMGIGQKPNTPNAATGDLIALETPLLE
jgi:hypothetical protein